MFREFWNFSRKKDLYFQLTQAWFLSFLHHAFGSCARSACRFHAHERSRQLVDRHHAHDNHFAVFKVFMAGGLWLPTSEFILHTPIEPPNTSNQRWWPSGGGRCGCCSRRSCRCSRRNSCRSSWSRRCGSCHDEIAALFKTFLAALKSINVGTLRPIPKAIV